MKTRKMNHSKRLFLLLSCLLLWGIAPRLTAQAAASASISFSSATVLEGNEVTATVTFESTGAGIFAVEAYLSYDEGVLQFVSGASANGGAGAVKIMAVSDDTTTKKVSYKLTFRAKKAGTCALKITESSLYDVDETLLGTPIATKSVTVRSLASLSSNANLKRLTVSEGTLNPAFAADKTSYTVEVPFSVATLTVSATAADSAASVKTSGSSSLIVGKNTRVVTVTAEDGTQKKYTITITRREDTSTPAPPATPGPVNPSLEVTLDGLTWFVQETFDEDLPEDFEEITYTYQNQFTVSAGKGLGTGLILLYLRQETEIKGTFYLYLEAQNEFLPYQELSMKAGTYILLNPQSGQKDVPSGYTITQAEIAGKTVTVWESSAMEQAEFYLVYAMNWNGESGLYQYDTKEGTMQRFLGGAAKTEPSDGTPIPSFTPQPIVQSGLFAGSGMLSTLFFGVCALCLVLIIVIVLLALRKKGTDLAEDIVETADPDAAYLNEEQDDD